MFGRIPTSRRILAGAALGLGAAALLASCDLGDEVVSPPPPPAVVHILITSHADTVFAAVATQVQFTAVAHDASGAPIPSAAITWSSSEINVAAVDATGRALALTAGFTSIRARSGAIQSAPVVLQVLPAQQVVASVVITGPAVPEVQAGGTIQFTAEARDALGDPIAGTAFQWSSSNPAVAGIDVNGLAMGLAAGTSDIRARANAIDSAPLTLTVFVPAISFATDIQPLFHPTCSATNCHGGSFPQEGLSLSPPGAYGNIVNQFSNQIGNLFLVEPGDPDNSYLYRKLLPCAFPNCLGDRMPRNLGQLPQPQLDLIRNWIATGARP